MKIKKPNWIPLTCPACESKNTQGFIKANTKYIKCGDCDYTNRISTQKCVTCWGYGLWAIGEPRPMGEKDYRDGMPNKQCPECGRGGNQ